MQLDGRAAKVLLVDPDRTALEMVQIRLDVAGFHPLVARTGRAALDMLAAERPDAVLLERNLPDMDGMVFLKEVAANPGRAPPILLVGRNLGADDVRASMQLGVRDCLAKPFSGAAVIERLTRMLKRHAPAARPALYINA